MMQHADTSVCVYESQLPRLDNEHDRQALIFYDKEDTMKNRVRNFTSIFLALATLLLGAGGALSQEWVQMQSPVTTPLKCVWGVSSSDVYAVGSGGVVLHYDGSAWSKITTLPNLTENLMSIYGTSASNIIIVGSNGLILQYNGTAWEKRESPTSNILYSVWCSSASDIFIAGEQGAVIHCDENDCVKEDYVITDFYLYGVWGASAGNVFTAGGGGTIARYDGKNWAVMESNSTKTLNSIWGASATDIYAAGMEGTLLHYNGTVWTPLNVIKRDFYAVGGTPSPYRVYVAGKDGKISYKTSNDAAASWTDVTSGTPYTLQSIWFSKTNDGFIVGDKGTILHYTSNAPVDTPPAAEFTVTISTDDSLTVYVDASQSSDNQTQASDLQVRWDWESDGVYETAFSTTKLNSHTYPAAGTYTITAEVKDSGGLTATASQEITLTVSPGGCPAQQLLGEADPRLETARRFRDQILLKSAAGKVLIRAYYAHAETINSLLDKNPRLSSWAKYCFESLLPLIEPLVEKQ